MVEHMSDASHIHSIETWDSGGGIELEIIELDGGPTFVVSDEVVTVYRSADDFWEEANEGGDGRLTLAILRETGKVMELTRRR